MTVTMKKFSVTIFILLVSLSGCAIKRSNLTQTEAKPSLQVAQNNFRAGDYKTALSELTLLSLNKDREAQYALGYMYYYGLGTSQNFDLARGWFRESAAAGYQQAQQALDQLDQPVSSAFPGFSPAI
jgi:TPR repeat protein